MLLGLYSGKPTDMTVLRFGSPHLSAPEVWLVKAFFRLYSQDPTFRWTIVEGPPYDLSLIHILHMKLAALLRSGGSIDHFSHFTKAPV